MNNESFFYEKQKFNQWWSWLIVLGLLFYFGYLFFLPLAEDVAEIQEKRNDFVVFSIVAITLLIILNIARLETTITKSGITVYFFPFHRKEKQFTWDSISKAYVRTYAPIKEFGGWGIRYRLFNKGKAYNVSGNKGLQIEFHSGEKLLIGTHRAETINEILTQLHKTTINSIHE